MARKIGGELVARHRGRFSRAWPDNKLDNIFLRISPLRGGEPLEKSRRVMKVWRTTFLAIACLLCLSAEAGADEGLQFVVCVKTLRFLAREQYLASMDVEYAKEREIYATRDVSLKGCPSPKNASCKTRVKATAMAALKVVAQEKAVIQTRYRSDLDEAYDGCLLTVFGAHPKPASRGQVKTGQ